MARYPTADRLLLLWTQLAGLVFVVVGALGMFVARDQAADRLGLIGHRTGPPDARRWVADVALHVNLTQNLIHLAIGVACVTAGLVAAAAVTRAVAALATVALLAVGLAGVVGGDNPFGIFDTQGAVSGLSTSDDVLHLVAGGLGALALLGVGVGLTAQRRAHVPSASPQPARR